MSQPIGYSEGADVVSDTSSQVAGDTAAPDATLSADAPQQVADDFKDNPAWKPVLEAIPSQFHGIVKPVLKQWDSNYGRLAESYAPYKEFSQQYPTVNSEILQRAYTLYDTLDKNPQELYRRLGEYLGVNANTTTPDTPEQVNIFEDETTSEQQPTDPRYEALQQQVMQQQQQLQAFQQAQMADRYTQQLDSEIKQLQKAHGNFDVKDVMNRVLAQMQRGEEPSIQKAFQEQQSFIQMVMANSKPAPPQVLSPGGGTPANTENLSIKTQDDRVNAFEAMLRAAQ